VVTVGHRHGGQLDVRARQAEATQVGRAEQWPQSTCWSGQFFCPKVAW
jgi:hypothetical protein